MCVYACCGNRRRRHRRCWPVLHAVSAAALALQPPRQWPVGRARSHLFDRRDRRQKSRRGEYIFGQSDHCYPPHHRIIPPPPAQTPAGVRQPQDAHLRHGARGVRLGRAAPRARHGHNGHPPFACIPQRRGGRSDGGGVAAERAVRPEGVFNHQSPSTDTTHSLCTRALLPLSLVPALSLHLSPTSTPTRAQVEVVVPAERPTLQVARWLRGPFALGSPSNAWGDRIATHLNTAVQLQHRRCSARCLARWASASASPFSQEDHPGRGLWQASPHVHSPALPTGELFSSDQDGLNALSLTRQCTAPSLSTRR